ncbi:MAG: RluA family pseudouridine synthase [Campylobacterales bacterium]|nr:RluA family pseudouridine synthase [Campylobacterales bacterium]
MSVESFYPSQSGRLDKVLSTHMSVSRNQVEKLIEKELVKVNGKVITKTSQKVSEGDAIEYQIVELEERKDVTVDFDVAVIYEDEHLLVINKPSGLVVHPAPSVKEPTLVDWLMSRGISLSTISGEERHGIVHRIDKETTGALVVAKTNEAHEALSLQLEDKSMGRYYIAIIDYPLKESTTVEAPIARSPSNRLKMAVVEGGKSAKSSFAKIKQSKKQQEIIVAKLFTGRTHQIRVHLAQLGRHILGDTLYGYRDAEIPRVFLHARLLYFVHPLSGEMMEFEAPIFEDMQTYIQKEFGEDAFQMLHAQAIKESFNASY